MAQGGFSRDYARAARIRQEAQARKEKEERGLIGDEVIVKLNPYFENKISRVFIFHWFIFPSFVDNKYVVRGECSNKLLFIFI